nr:DUF6418 domain-containing protein [uncultured Celeribacter sp.]
MNALGYPMALTGLVALICLALMGSYIWPGAVWGYAALAGFAAYAVLLLQARPAVFVMLSPLLFLRGTEFLSGAAIESGAWIAELMRFGTPSGAFLRLLLIYLVGLIPASMFLQRIWQGAARDDLLRVMREVDRHWAFWPLGGLILLLTGYVALVGAAAGFPLLEGVDRFTYRSGIGNRLVTSYIDNRYVVVLVLALFVTARRGRWLTGLNILAIFLVSILYAEKFTSISLMLILLMMPAALLRIAEQGRLPVLGVLGVVAAIVAVTAPLVLYVYGVSENPVAAWQRVLSRAAAQGELWWIADRGAVAFAYLDTDVLAADVASWWSLAAQNTEQAANRFGLYFVMDAYAPSDIALQARYRGTGYIFSLFAYALMVSGYLGACVVSLATHLVFAIVMGFVLAAIAHGRIWCLIVAGKLFVWCLAGGFIVGYLWFFFGIKTAALIAAYLTLWSLGGRGDITRRAGAGVAPPAQAETVALGASR